MNKIKNKMIYVKYLVISLVMTYNTSVFADITSKETLYQSRKSIQQVATVLNWFTGISFAVAFLLSMAAIYVNAYRTGRSMQAGDSSSLTNNMLSLGKLVTNIAIASATVTIVAILARVIVFVTYNL